MSDQISFRRKSLGRYQVFYDGSAVGEVRTTCYNHHWCWVVVGGRPADRCRHFHSRDAAALAAVTDRMA